LPSSHTVRMIDNEFAAEPATDVGGWQLAVGSCGVEVEVS